MRGNNEKMTVRWSELTDNGTLLFLTGDIWRHGNPEFIYAEDGICFKVHQSSIGTWKAPDYEGGETLDGLWVELKDVYDGGREGETFTASGYGVPRLVSDFLLGDGLEKIEYQCRITNPSYSKHEILRRMGLKEIFVSATPNILTIRKIFQDESKDSQTVVIDNRDKAAYVYAYLLFFMCDGWQFREELWEESEPTITLYNGYKETLSITGCFRLEDQTMMEYIDEVVGDKIEVGDLPGTWDIQKR